MALSRIWHFGRFTGEVAFYPYQIALGMTVRMFEGVASIRLHAGPVKVWLGFRTGHEWDRIDEEIQAEIQEEWSIIILTALRASKENGRG